MDGSEIDKNLKILKKIRRNDGELLYDVAVTLIEYVEGNYEQIARAFNSFEAYFEENGIEFKKNKEKKNADK